MKFEPYEFEDAFEEYMRKVAPSVKETDVQWRESRRVWVAATRRLLNYFTEHLVNFPDEVGVKELQRLLDSTTAYWRTACEDKD